VIFVKYKALYLFCGIGGGALGFKNACVEYKGLVGQFETLAGIDCDPLACEDFEKLTGGKAIQMDLFTRENYIAFHGKEPPVDWHEVTPEDLFNEVGDYPDVIFLSPPCKGFSGLLPSASAASEKYQALNRLVVRSMKLVSEAFYENLPSCILIENVPRITTRGAKLIESVEDLLGDYGYVFDHQTHDCGEIGGLGQRRKRFLLIARNKNKMPAFIKPTIRKLKAVGDVIGPLPLPDDRAAGPLHKLPRLQWKTWVRLALIPAGGDWRDLQDIKPEQYRIMHEPRNCSFGVMDWNNTSSTVTGNMRPGGSCASVISDPRINFKKGTHTAIYRISRWAEAAGTITGAHRPNNGAPCVPDPRLKSYEGKDTGVYQVVRWEESGPCITGTRFDSGAPAISDPRTCALRAGTYGVMAWDEPAKTVIGSADVHAGTAAVADPRIPVDNESGVWIIKAEDGTWHRPLTTYELAALQSFSLTMADGSPLTLAGKSDARWREAIGNAVPPVAAQVIAEQILPSLMASSLGEWFMNSNQIWVHPFEDDINADETVSY
jgi:site-specific DNA-cytosine methylase